MALKSTNAAPVFGVVGKQTVVRKFGTITDFDDFVNVEDLFFWDAGPEETRPPFTDRTIDARSYSSSIEYYLAVGGIVFAVDTGSQHPSTYSRLVEKIPLFLEEEAGVLSAAENTAKRNWASSLHGTLKTTGAKITLALRKNMITITGTTTDEEVETISEWLDTIDQVSTDPDEEA